jgi:hypothetical protein
LLLSFFEIKPKLSDFLSQVFHTMVTVLALNGFKQSTGFTTRVNPIAYLGGGLDARRE